MWFVLFSFENIYVKDCAFKYLNRLTKPSNVTSQWYDVTLRLKPLVCLILLLVCLRLTYWSLLRENGSKIGQIGEIWTVDRWRDEQGFLETDNRSGWQKIISLYVHLLSIVTHLTVRCFKCHFKSCLCVYLLSFKAIQEKNKYVNVLKCP